MKEEMAGEKMENEITKKVPKDGAKGQVNPYKACIYGLCRDFLDGNGYDLGTKILIFWRKMLSRRSLSTIQPRFRIFYVKDTNYFCIKLTTLANDL